MEFDRAEIALVLITISPLPPECKLVVGLLNGQQARERGLHPKNGLAFVAYLA